jgi:HEPN domain-containing protein
VTRDDFRKLSEARLTGAKVLLGARRFDAAYYLAGYAVECAIKAYIAKQTRKYQFPEGPERARKIYTHDIEELIKVAKLSGELDKELKSDPLFEANWGAAKVVSESKKFENHWAAVCLHFACYNSYRIHKSLRVTPAMEAELTDHIWTIEELLS